MASRTKLIERVGKLATPRELAMLGMGGVSSFQSAVDTGGVQVPAQALQQMMGRWSGALCGDLKSVLAQAVMLGNEDGYVQPVTDKKAGIFTRRARVFKRGRELAYPQIERFVRETMRRFLVADNVVAVWRKGRGSNRALPQITLVDPSACEYSNQFGIGKLKLLFKKVKLSEGEAAGLDPRIRTAMEKGTPLELSEAEGDGFSVLTRTDGVGFTMPTLKPFFTDLMGLELHKVADMSGAFARRRVMRHVKGGHKVDGSGPLAGSSTYFMDKREGKSLVNFLNGLAGYAELVTNFDWDFDYVYLDPEFFDPKVTQGLMARLDQWAGPMGFIMRSGREMSLDLMTLLREEMLDAQGMVGGFLKEIFGMQDFGQGPVEVVWDETACFSMEQLRAWVTMGYTNGLMSAPTARRVMGLDDARESAENKRTNKDPDGYKPPFEAKQGMVAMESGTMPGRKGGGGDGNNDAEADRGGRPDKGSVV